MKDLKKMVKKKKKKRSFYEFARSEIKEVKYAGGFFVVLAWILNYDNFKVFLIALGFIIFFGILIIFDQYVGWIKYLKE